MRLDSDGTSKAEIRRVLVEFDVFTSNAESLVGSFMPIGLGRHWQREHDELTRQLQQIRARFERAIARAQRKGWAAK